MADKWGQATGTLISNAFSSGRSSLRRFHATVDAQRHCPSAITAHIRSSLSPALSAGARRATNDAHLAMSPYSGSELLILIDAPPPYCDWYIAKLDPRSLTVIMTSERALNDVIRDTGGWRGPKDGVRNSHKRFMCNLTVPVRVGVPGFHTVRRFQVQSGDIRAAPKVLFFHYFSAWKRAAGNPAGYCGMYDRADRP
ncbi:hypothetical protein BJV78DRAFT_1354604 [Lactifluus subvellereus]|nr:hypothetical protein BJV78DRAFT_1354604 [Lactifluus subvellereus]